MSKLLKWAFILFPFFLLLGLLSLTYFSREFLTPVSEQQQAVRVVISPGMGGAEIGQVLESNALVRHAWSFRLLVRLTKTGSRIKAGTYDLSPSQNAYDLLKKLVSGDVVQIRITIPEGYTLQQIARLLQAKGISDASQFEEKAKEATFFIPETGESITGLEGFLFPDTYDLSPNITPEEAYAPMLKRFQDLVTPFLSEIQKKNGFETNHYAGVFD